MAPLEADLDGTNTLGRDPAATHTGSLARIMITTAATDSHHHLWASTILPWPAVPCRALEDARRVLTTTARPCKIKATADDPFLSGTRTTLGLAQPRLTNTLSPVAKDMERSPEGNHPPYAHSHLLYGHKRPA